MNNSVRIRRGLWYAVLLILLSIGSQVFAQEEYPQGYVMPTGMDMPAPPRTERRLLLSTEFQERIVNLTGNASLRLSKVVDRFGDITERLDTRIQKIKANGIDTSTSEVTLAEAKELLDLTTLKLEGLESVRSAIVSETPRESFTRIRTELLTARENLRRVQTLLQETITLLRDSLGRGVITPEVMPASNNAPLEVTTE